MIVIQVKILVMETPVVHWFIARAIKKENPGIRLELSALDHPLAMPPFRLSTQGIINLINHFFLDNHINKIDRFLK